MKFGYTIIYVPDVAKALNFYEAAFGCAVKFLHDSGAYGELDTGGTTLAFASHDMADFNGFEIHAPNADATAVGIEIAFVTDDVAAAFTRAVQAGATALSDPMQKPWGQEVSYVRDLNGVIVEICAPIAGTD